MARLKHKRGRKSNYVKSLDNTNHREAREKCLLRDRFQCRFPGCDKRIGLEFHHIDYKVLGEELEFDNLKWTVILCEDHHTEVHQFTNHKWNPKNWAREPINN